MGDDQSTDTAEGTAESSLRPPESWRRTLLLRRGGWFTHGRRTPPAPAAAATAFAALLATDRAALEHRLRGPDADAALGEEALAAREQALVAGARALVAGEQVQAARVQAPIAGPPALDPVEQVPADEVVTADVDGVTARDVSADVARQPGQARSDVTPRAVAALLAAASRSAHDSQPDPRLADAAAHWAARRGLPFAAQVAVELAGLSAASGIRPLTGDDGSLFSDWADFPAMPFTATVRNRLAVAPDADYAEAEALLTPYRRGGVTIQRLVATFLIPTRGDWVEQDVAALARPAPVGAAAVVLASVRTPEQLRIAVAALEGTGYDLSALLPTMIEGVGTAIAPILADWQRSFRWTRPAETERRLLSALSWVPADAAFQALLDTAGHKPVRQVLLTAAARYPRRALRLTARSDAPIAAELLRGHLARHPELADVELPAEDRRRVDALLDTVPDAPPDRLPPVLVSPPWSAPAGAARPMTVPGLRSTATAGVDWLPGEREDFAASFTPPEVAEDFEAMAAGIRRSRGRHGHLAEDPRFFVLGPEELVRPLLPDWRTWRVEGAGIWLHSLLARYGTDAVRPAADLVPRHIAAAGALLPCTGVRVTGVMTLLLNARNASARDVARRWLGRHPAAAARDLVPDALGAREDGAHPARHALLTLAGAGHRDTIIEAARGYGEEAATAIVHLLDTDPLTLLPADVPALPRWTDPESLPRVRLRDGSGALPPASVRHLLVMLALERRAGGIPLVAQRPHQRLAVAAESLDPGDLAAFSWALCEKWLAAGAPSREDWPLTTLPIFGDDDTVRRLSVLIQVWPGQSAHTRAVTGVTVLAEFGTGAALTELHRIATTVRYRGLRERAAEQLAELAAAMGLDTEQLADRLVPDLGLDADGTMRLDRWTVGFDEQLTPYVTEGTGKRLRSLPRTATEASARFTALKKQARALAAEQLRRLEQAMVTGRRWTGAELRAHLIAHPLLRHVARRLVWAEHDGGRVRGFRVAEDLSLADVHDTPVRVRDDAVIGLPHPLELGDALPAWAEVFADYRIVQPFPQLGRPVHVFRAADFAEREVLTVRVLGLERQGWERDRAEERGVRRRIVRVIGRYEITVELDPGFAPYATVDKQRLGRIEVVERRPGWLGAARRVDPSGLDPVTASELARELSTLLP